MTDNAYLKMGHEIDRFMLTAMLMIILMIITTTPFAESSVLEEGSSVNSCALSVKGDLSFDGYLLSSGGYRWLDGYLWSNEPLWSDRSLLSYVEQDNDLSMQNQRQMRGDERPWQMS